MRAAELPPFPDADEKPCGNPSESPECALKTFWMCNEQNVDVCKLAQTFGGGGHKYASGCTIPGTLSSVVPKVHKLAESLLSSPTLSLEPPKK